MHLVKKLSLYKIFNANKKKFIFWVLHDLILLKTKSPPPAIIASFPFLICIFRFEIDLDFSLLKIEQSLVLVHYSKNSSETSLILSENVPSWEENNRP